MAPFVVFRSPMVMLSDSERLERVIARALQLKFEQPIEDMLAEGDAVSLTHRAESPFRLEHKGKNLGFAKIEDDLEEIISPSVINTKKRTQLGFFRSRRVQKVMTFAATTIAVGLSVSALLLYKDTLSEAISGSDLVYTFDL